MSDDIQWETPPATAAPSASNDIQWESQAANNSLETPSGVSLDPHPYRTAMVKTGDSLAQSSIDMLKGTVKAFDPRLHEGESASNPLPLPVQRIVKGIIDGIKPVGQVPAAIKDINQSDNPALHYADAVGDTASAIGGMGVAGAITGGLGKDVSEINPKAALQATKETAIDAAKAAVPSPLKELGKFKARYDAAKSVITDPNEISDTLKDILKGKPQPEAAPVEAAPKVDPTSPHAEAFEKTFGLPLADYMDEKGFNMKDFLHEVVKPRSEPVPYVISRVFGSDGVKLIQDISGKPIEKWEPMGPTKAQRAAAKAKTDSVTPSVPAAPAQQ